jgi:hypothetical protein
VSVLVRRIEPSQAQHLSVLQAQDATASEQVNFIQGPPGDSEVGGLPFLFGSARGRYRPEGVGGYRSSTVPESPAAFPGADTAAGQHTQQQIARTAVEAGGSAGGELKAVIPAPIRALLAVFRRWDIPDELGAMMLGTDDPGSVAKLRFGVSSLRTRDELDRVRLVIDIYEGVFALLRDPNSEQTWIRTPRSDFDGHSLLEMMTEGSQRNLIRALAFVDYVNGR